MRKYTLEQINEIVNLNGWSVTSCPNEKNGKTCNGTDTYQIAVENDAEYFGEFVGKPSEDKYSFKLYTL